LSFKNYLISSLDYGLGRPLENSIYLYYRLQGYKIYVGRLGNKEIDFIIEKNGDKKYIQSVYLLSDKKIIEREFGSLEEVRDAYEKIVISLDDVCLGNKNGIKHIRAWDMFTNF